MQKSTNRKMEHNRTRYAIRCGFTLLKFAYPVLLSLLAIRLTHTPKYTYLMATVAFLIFIITNAIAYKNKTVSWLIGVIALFVLYAQAFVLFFSGVYVQTIMLTNLASLRALSGKAILYGLGVVISLAVLFLPIEYIPIKGKNMAPTVLWVFSLLS